MQNSTSISKNSQTYYLTQHSIQRTYQRTNFNLNQLSQSFINSKIINHQTIHKFPILKTKFNNIQSSFNQSNTILFFNPTTLTQFRVDKHNNNIITIIQH